MIEDNCKFCKFQSGTGIIISLTIWKTYIDIEHRIMMSVLKCVQEIEFQSSLDKLIPSLKIYKHNCQITYRILFLYITFIKLWVQE